MTCKMEVRWAGIHFQVWGQSHSELLSTGSLQKALEAQGNNGAVLKTWRVAKEPSRFLGTLFLHWEGGRCPASKSQHRGMKVGPL